MKSLILILAVILLASCGGSSTESPTDNEDQTGNSGNIDTPENNEESPGDTNEEPPGESEEPPVDEVPDINWDQGEWNNFNWQ